MFQRVRVRPALLGIFVVPAMAFAWLSGSAWGQDVRPVLPTEPAPAAITVPSRWTCTDAETPALLPASAPVPAEYRSTNRYGSGWDIERTDNTARLRFLTYDERGRPVWYVSSTGLFSPETQTWSGGLYREDLTPNGVRQVLVGSAAAQWIPEHPERVALRWRMGEVGANEEEECLWRTSASPMERGRWTLEHTTPVDVIELRSATESRLTVLTHDQNGAPVWTTGTRASSAVPALQRYHRGIYRGDAYGARCVESDCVTTRPAGQIVGQFSDTRQPSANVRLEAVGVGADQLVALAAPPDNGGTVVARSSPESDFTIVPSSGQCVASAPGASCQFTLSWSNPWPDLYILTWREVESAPGFYNWQLEYTGNSNSRVISVRPNESGGTGEVTVGAYSMGQWVYQRVVKAVVGAPSPPPIPIGDPVLCRSGAGGNPITPGDTPGIPGLWYNPQRSGTGWILDFFEANRLNATWYTYDSSLAPVWLAAENMQIGTETINSRQIKHARGRLLRYQWNGTASPTEVGQVSIAFDPEDPASAALRWTWDAISAQTQSECIYEISHGRSLSQRNSQTFSGLWWESALPSYSVSPYLASPSGGIRLDEYLNLAIYDQQGQPRWVQGYLESPPGEVPPPSANNIPVNVLRSPFGSAGPIQVPPQSAQSAQIGTISRTWPATIQQPANFVIAINSQTAQNPPAWLAAPIQWNRGAVWQPAVLSRYVGPNRRVVMTHRQQCVTQAPDNCPIRVSWDAGNAGGQLVRKSLLEPYSEETLSFQGYGNQVINHTVPGRYQYLLRQWGATVATSASVEVSLPRSVSLSANPASGLVAPGSTTLSGTLGGSTTGIVSVRVDRTDTNPHQAVCSGAPTGTQYSCSWSGIAAGTYKLVARALGANQAVLASSAELTLVVGSTTAVVIPDDQAFANYLPNNDDYRATSPELVGAIPAEAGVSGGQASYSIPLKIPPGRNGMQPALSLSYSSRAGNGIAGMGFSLSGTSAITRCPRTVALDGVAGAVRYDPNDRLCLDGQRLVLVAGSYGAQNSEYRTEINSHARIRLLGAQMNEAGAYFEVAHKSGQRMYFGADQHGGDPRNSHVNPSGAPFARTLSWLLNTALDLNGNNIRYSYSVAGSGENLLSEIRYTGFGTQPGTRKIQFVYLERPDFSESFLAGGRTAQTQRLDEVTMEIDGLQVRRYKLEYATSQSTHRSRLFRLTECANGQCLPPNVFAWQDWQGNESQFATEVIQWPASMPVPGSTPGLPVLDDVAVLGDIDGDGVVEVRRVLSHAGTVKHFVVAFNADRSARGWIERQTESEARDLNNDGRAELVHADLNSANPAASRLVITQWRPLERCAGLACEQFVDANFMASSLDICSIRPAIPLGQSSVFKMQFADFNGDGKSDLVVHSSGACDRGLGLYVHLNESNTEAFVFASTPVFIPFHVGASPGELEALAHIGDLDGDGLAEVVTSIKVGASRSNVVLSPMFSPGLSFTRQCFGQRLGETCVVGFNWAVGNTFLVPANARHSFFTDVNGDGLTDLLLATPHSLDGSACNSEWTIRINEGGRFATPVTLTEASAGARKAGLEVFQQGNSCRPYAGTWDGPLSGLISPVDLDADGRSELMVPRGVRDSICTTVYANPNNKGFLAFSLCPADPRSVNLPSANTLTLAYNDWFQLHSPPPSPGVGHSVIEDFSILDSSTYTMSRLMFQQDASGGYRVREVPLPDSFARQTASSSSGLNGVDFYGDGMGDGYYSSGCRIHWLGQSQNACTRDSGSVPMLGSPWLLVNNGAGRTNYGNGKLGASQAPDLLVSASDAFGLQAQWYYEPLSSEAGRPPGSLPLYRVPARESGAGYVDSKHFYFTSSMNVVAELKVRDGLGGLRITRYGYEEAMYNNQGRGFVGFRKIITEDLGGGDTNGTRSATIFEQKFPMVSRPVCEVTQALSDPLEELRCDSQRALESTVTEYFCNGMPHANDACVFAVMPVDIHVRRRTKERRELVAARPLVARIVDFTPHDQYGNLVQHRQFTNDYVAGGELARAKTVITTNEYVNDESNWWINKLEFSTVNSSQSYGAGHPGGPGVPSRSISTRFAYDGARRVICDAQFAGNVGVGACDAGAAERRTAYTYDEYGNVTMQAVTARDETQPRVVATQYSNSVGYFPNVVTDSYGKQTTTVFDARHGVPTSVTDANGLITTSQLDALGRVTRVVPPMQGGLQAAMPTVTVYERCASHCEPGAVMTVVSSQFHGGQQVQFIDALGRVLRTAKSTLNSGYARNWAGLTLGSFSTVEVRYDARGREILQVQPSFGSASLTQATTTELRHDPLGRVIAKVESFQNASDVGFGQRTHRRTEYVHNGLTTDIRVCQVASVGAACPTTANINNPDGSPVLNLSRTFDGGGGLLWTRDANGQPTKFWSDGAGNVLRITDVKQLSINAVYDDFGRRTSVTDPSRGTWSFTYNGFGELKTQTDQRQLSQTVGYDLLGRKVSRTWTEPRDAETWSFAESWVYENASATQYGVLKSQERQATVGGVERERWSRSYTHDALNRVTGQSTTLRSGSSL